MYSVQSQKISKRAHSKKGASSHSDRCKILSDGIPISHGTLYGDLGGITIFRPPGQMVIDAI